MGTLFLTACSLKRTWNKAEVECVASRYYYATMIVSKIMSLFSTENVLDYLEQISQTPFVDGMIYSAITYWKMIDKWKPLWVFFCVEGRFKATFWSKLRSLGGPDEPFHNFRASRSGDWPILCSSETSWDGFWSFKNVKVFVGEARCTRPTLPPFWAPKSDIWSLGSKFVTGPVG